MSECSCNPLTPSPDVDIRSLICSGPLLDRVQRSNMFPDCKYFVDMSCIYTPAQTMADYQMFSNCSKNDGSLGFLQMFVERHFKQPGSDLEPWTPTDWKAQPSFLNRVSDPQIKKYAAEINELWKQLGRRIVDDVQRNPELYSILYVPKPFIIPDTGCREYSYWGSFWIIRGLLQCGMIQTARGMIENFLYMVQQYGYVPACGRIYCLERTQPPLLIMMMKAYVEVTKDEQFAIQSLPLLETEFETFVSQRSIEVKGRTMYQYRTASSTPGPRPEAYTEDLAAAEGIKDETAREKCYTELKSACESGQEFSSRWFVAKDCSHEPTVSDTRTSVIVPVELNAIIFRSGKILAEFNRKAGNARKAEEYQDRSCVLVKAIRDVLWNSQAGIWLDYDVEKKQSRNYFCCTNFAPLWARAFPLIDTEKVSKGVMEYIKTNKLDDLYGGVPHTLNKKSGEMWDYPNVFPPMMFMVVEGLDNLGTRASKAMSKRWAHRWVKSNYDAFKTQGFMFEKYFCEEFGSSGTCPSQPAVGYGWSNAVVIEFLCKYGKEISMSEDEDKACQCKAGKNKDSYVITSHASMETNAFRTTSREVEKKKSCVCAELISKTTAAIGTQSSAFRPAPSSKSMERKSCSCSTNRTTNCGQVLDDCSCVPPVPKPQPQCYCGSGKDYASGRCRHQDVPTCSCSISRTQMVPVELGTEHFPDCPCYHDYGTGKSSKGSRSSSKPKKEKQPKQQKQKDLDCKCENDSDLRMKGSASADQQKMTKKQKKQQEDCNGYSTEEEQKNSKKSKKQQQEEMSRNSCEDQPKNNKKSKQQKDECNSYSAEEKNKNSKKSKQHQDDCSCYSYEEQQKSSKKSKQHQDDCSCYSYEEQQKSSKKSKQHQDDCSCYSYEEQQKSSKKSKQHQDDCSCYSSEEQQKSNKKSKQQKDECNSNSADEKQKNSKKSKQQQDDCSCYSSEEQPKNSKKSKQQKDECNSNSADEKQKNSKKSKQHQDDCSCYSSEEQPKNSKKSKQQKDDCSNYSSEEQPKNSKKSKQHQDDCSNYSSEEQPKNSKKSKQHQDDCSCYSCEEQQKSSKKSKQHQDDGSCYSSDEQENSTKKQKQEGKKARETKSKESVESPPKKGSKSNQKKPDQKPCCCSEDRERESQKRQSNQVGYFAPLADKTNDDCPKSQSKKNKLADCCNCCDEGDEGEDDLNCGERRSPSNEVYFSPEATSTPESGNCSAGPSAQPSKVRGKKAQNKSSDDCSCSGGSGTQASGAKGKRAQNKSSDDCSCSGGSGTQASKAQGKCQESKPAKSQPQQSKRAKNQETGPDCSCPGGLGAQSSASQASVSHGKGAHGSPKEFKLCRSQPQPERMEVEGCSPCHGGLDTLQKSPGRLQHSPCYGGQGPSGYSPTDQNIAADDCPCFMRNIGADDIWCGPCAAGKHAQVQKPQDRQGQDRSTQSSTAICPHCGGVYSDCKPSPSSTQSMGRNDPDDCECDPGQMRGMSNIGLQRGCCKPEPRHRADWNPKPPKPCNPAIPGYYPKAGEFCGCHGGSPSPHNTPTPNTPPPKRNFEVPVYGPNKVPCTCGAGSTCQPDPVPSGRPAPVSSSGAASARSRSPARSPARSQNPATAPAKCGKCGPGASKAKDYTAGNGSSPTYNKLFPLKDPVSTDELCKEGRKEKCTDELSKPQNKEGGKEKCCCCKEKDKNKEKEEEEKEKEK